VNFWLGTHEVSWLGRTDVPLFVSRRRLARQKKWARALGPWALDSGGFTELSMNRRWSITLGQYAAEVERWRDEIGNLAWCAPMDWMCEPSIIRGTGLTVREHQARTIDNFGGLSLHAFGVRSQALQAVVEVVASADSMAWSSRARNAHNHGEPRPTPCTHVGSCANCMAFALWWREEQLSRPARPVRDYQVPLISREV
jgi:hypothetical protein